MRIAVSLAVLLAASILPAAMFSAHAQNADDVGATHGISTSHLSQGASQRGYRSRGYRSRAYKARGYSRSHAHRQSHAGGGASRACLTGPTRQVLAGLEARFGAVKVISTCRPGAVIAGSGRPSQHRYGKAVDFMPNGNRAAMMAWLRANTNGAVITYASGHIHFDTGGYRNFAVSAKARKSFARAR
jgi:uncharacterized protein YcbK (DUF882 family)